MHISSLGFRLEQSIKLLSHDIIYLLLILEIGGGGKDLNNEKKQLTNILGLKFLAE